MWQCKLEVTATWSHSECKKNMLHKLKGKTLEMNLDYPTKFYWLIQVFVLQETQPEFAPLLWTSYVVRSCHLHPVSSFFLSVCTNDVLCVGIVSVFFSGFVVQVPPVLSNTRELLNIRLHTKQFYTMCYGNPVPQYCPSLFELRV